jgi:hypothetical protein
MDSETNKAVDFLINMAEDDLERIRLKFLKFGIMFADFAIALDPKSLQGIQPLINELVNIYQDTLKAGGATPKEQEAMLLEFLKTTTMIAEA